MMNPFQGYKSKKSCTTVEAKPTQEDQDGDKVGSNDPDEEE
jgi:hypothetical protein